MSITPREPQRGKNVAATSPEHGKGTLRHWEAAQDECSTPEQGSRGPKNPLALLHWF